MPELPELQAHAERLTAGYTGSRLEKFTALSFTALKTFSPPPDTAVASALGDVTRRGKYLILAFPECSYVVHLMQGGRLKEDPKQATKPRGGLARWSFDDGRALLLTEAGTEKRAGIWVVDGNTESQEPIIGIGPDADAVTVDELTSIVAANSKRLHGLLRDQRAVAGIGRRLANEICFRARLSPFANASKLTDEQIQRLHTAIAFCIDESLAAERERDEMSSSKQRAGAVHHNKGEPCPVCGEAIRTVEYNRYTVAYCPGCQTDGRVLADNTTSRFLK